MTSPAELRETPALRADFPTHELSTWAADLGLVAGVTNRNADFGLTSPQPAGAVLDRWRRFRWAMRPAFGTVVVAHQCHGTRLAIHEGTGSHWRVEDETDGHLTCQGGVLLTVTVADCVPVYLVQLSGSWIGLLHAGWRGIAAGIVERGIVRLRELAGCPRAEVAIHCGVSVCADCYEVRPEVSQAVGGDSAQGKVHLDLRAQIVARAARLGVLQATVSPWCAAHDREAFFSHRRSGGADGRMLAYLGRPLA